MIRNVEPDPETGWVKQPLAGAILAGFGVFFLLASVSSILPSISIQYVSVSLPLGVLGTASFIWLNLHPNLYARFFLNVALAGLCSLIAYRSIAFLLPIRPGFLAGLILTTVIAAHTLPLWNVKAARSLRLALAMPGTKLGRIVIAGWVMLMLGAGVAGPVLASMRHLEGRYAPGSLLSGMTTWLFALLLPFAHRFPSSPWEAKDQR